MRPRLWESLIPGLGHVRRGVGGAWRPLLFLGIWLTILLGRRERIVELFGPVSLDKVAMLLFWPVFGVGLWLLVRRLRRRGLALGRRVPAALGVAAAIAAAIAAVLWIPWSAPWRTWEAEVAAAFVFLLLYPVLLVWATHGNLVERVCPRPREGMGTWALAWREFKRRPSGTWGLTLLALLYVVVFLAPVLAPYDPDAQPPRDTIVVQALPPGAKVIVLGDRKRGERYCLAWRHEGDALVLDRGERATAENEVKLKDLGEPRRGWFRRANTVQRTRVGETEVLFREERYLLGTDTNGRDLLSRLIYGSRISLSIGFLAMALAVGLGILFGSVAGYLGRWVDAALMRFTDILLAFPRLLLLMLIITVYEGAGIWTVVLVLGLTGWMGVARLVRAEFLRLKELDYATAARALGFSRPRIMFKHLLPNAMAPVIVSATLRVGETILVEAALSFLALGVKPPTATWGNIVDDGRSVLATAGFIATFPGLCIVAAVVCFNLVGDALRDALDPRLRA